MARTRRQPAIQWNRHDPRTAALIAGVGEDIVVTTLRHLFRRRREVGLEGIAQGKSGAAVLLARPVDADGVPEVYRAVKLAPVADLRVEADNFEKHVNGKLPTSPHLFPIYLPASGIGAIAYTFVGNREDRIASIGQICSEALGSGNCDRILRLVDQLFRKRLNPWYFNPLHARQVNLFDEFGFSDQQLDSLRQIHLGPTSLSMQAGQLVETWCDIRRRLGYTPTRFTLVHGDMHAGNVMVNARDDAVSLIDFGMTGEGHFLRDFVKLEADLKFRNLVPCLEGATDEIANTFAQFDQSLLTPESFDLPAAEASSRAEASEGLTSPVSVMRSIVLAIRRSAADRMEHDAARIPEYFAGLVRYTLRMALYDDVTANQRLCMLASAQNILSCMRVDEFRQLLWEPDPVLSVSRSTPGSLASIKPEDARDQAVRKFIHYDLVAWAKYNEDQVESNIRFGGRVGARTADIVVFSDNTKVTSYMVCQWTTKGKDAPFDFVSDEWKWWSQNTELKCVVLFGEGAGWSGQRVFSRGSPDQPLAERDPYDPFPRPFLFASLQDPCDKKPVSIVKATLTHREFSRELIRLLVVRFQHLSYLTLHGSSSLYDPVGAREILDALASIEDPELQLQVLWETDATGPEGPDRHMLGWREHENLTIQGLFVPLWWRFSTEARLEYLGHNRMGEAQMAGQDYLLHEFLGLRLDPSRDYREHFNQRAHNYHHPDDEDKRFGRGGYETRPLQELWRELSYELTDAIPPEIIRRAAVYRHDWDHSQDANARWQQARDEATELLHRNDDKFDHLILGKDGDGIVITNLLGMYDPVAARIYIYSRIVDRCAAKLGVSQRKLASLVYIHETVHAFTHLGKDLNGCVWRDYALPRSEAFDFRPSVLHEGLAQYFSLKLIERLEDSSLLAVFEKLEEYQPAEYKAWRSMSQNTLEQMRQLLIRGRQDPFGS